MPPVLNPAYFEAIRRLIGESPYFKLLGMELMEMERGRALFHLATARKHLQPFGVVHGGALASVLDAACAWAVWADIPADRSMTTVDLKVNYLAPVRPDRKLGVEGKAIRIGRTLALAEARAEDLESRRLVGQATSTLMLLNSSLPEFMNHLPVKFV